MNDYTNIAHWAILIACIGLMLSAVGMDIAGLDSWHQLKTPFFIGSLISHIGSVIGAYISGRLFQVNELPTAPKPTA